MSDDKNYYEVLEVPSSATHQDILNAYTRAKNTYDGDALAMYSLMTNDERESILSQIEEAFSIIGDPDKRRQYDLARGYNQDHTPEGYNEKITTSPDYAPKKGTQELLEQTQPKYQIAKNEQDDFEYKEGRPAGSEVNISKVQAVQKFGLDYKVDDQMEQKIDNATEFTGTFLREIREYKNVSVERMAEMTRVSKTYIRTIEAQDFEKLPAVVYTRGFIYQIAKCLKLNPDMVAKSYMENMKRLKSGEPR